MGRMGDAGGRVIAAAWSTGFGITRNVAGALASFAFGISHLARGRMVDGLGRIGLGVVRVAQLPLDAVLMAGGALVSALQTLLWLEAPGRKLAPQEIALLRAIYGDSLDCRRIRIKEGNAGLLTVPNRPFTHGNTVYIPRKWLPMDARLLVHESAHVWQHQHGGTAYMFDSLFAQYLGDGYDYGKGLREERNWGQLNPEQQAEVVEMAFVCDLFADPEARFVHQGTDYTEQVRAMIAELRAGRGAPPSPPRGR